jgi:hypothetical protein
MKYLLGVVVAVVAVPMYLSAQAPAEPTKPVSSVVFVDHDKVAAALAKGGGLVSGSDVLVSGSHRDKPGQVEVHDKEMDVIYVVDGTATAQSVARHRYHRRHDAEAGEGRCGRRPCRHASLVQGSAHADQLLRG